MVKLVEFSNPINNDLPYDVIEDAIIFMRNDPMFYRKNYFPAVSKLADLHRAGKKVDPAKCLMPMIEQGCNMYVKKFNIGKGVDEVFNNDDRQALLNQIYTEELAEIEKGDYK
jgi:hypothetical protein